MRNTQPAGTRRWSSSSLVKKTAVAFSAAALLVGLTHATPAVSAKIATAVAEPSVVLAADNPIVWNIDDGKAAYVKMINHVRAGVEGDTGATRSQVPMGNGRELSVDTLNNTRTDSFLTVTVQSGSLQVHLYVRESDLYVVGYYYMNGNTREYVPLTEDAPIQQGNNVNVHNQYIGAESYIKLARMAGVSLASLTIGSPGLAQGVIDLRNPDGSAQAWARGMLRMIMAVSEGSRFRPLAGEIATNLGNFTDLTLGNRFVELVRNWSNISEVYEDHLHNGNSSTASTSTSHWGTIDDIRRAAQLLLISLNTGANPNPHDEL